MARNASAQRSQLDAVLETLSRHHGELTGRGVNHVWVFGSVARGDDREDSDIDLLVEIDPQSNISLSGFSRLRMDLEDMLGRKVDLGEWSTVRDEIDDDVRADAVMVF